MARIRWTQQMDDKLRKLYPHNDTDKVAEQMGVSLNSVRGRAATLGLHKAKDFAPRTAFKKGVATNGRMWTAEEDERLKLLYPNHTNEELATLFDRSKSSIEGRSSVLGLHKTKEFISHISKLRTDARAVDGVYPGMFKKGNVSWNKGKKGLHFAGSEKGHFKKGQLPPNTLHDGAIRLRNDKMKDGSIRQYYWIRISQGKWRELHRHLWEQANGTIPPKHVVIFKDGNSLNCVLDNLELITMKENVLRNSIHRYGPEVREVIMLTRKASKLINKHKNPRNHGKEQNVASA